MDRWHAPPEGNGCLIEHPRAQELGLVQRSDTGSLLVCRDVPAGTRLLTVASNTSPAVWGLSWPNGVPPPTVSLDSQPNVEWVQWCCPGCHLHFTTLVTINSMSRRTSTIVRTQQHILVPTAGSPLRVTFDGASRICEGTRRAGAGVVVWRRAVDERYDPITMVSLPLPVDTTALHAEVLACVEALRLLTIYSGTTRRAAICGDNLPVIRHLAGFGRLRDPEFNALLLPNLLILWSRGWELTWVPIPRTENVLADRLARRGMLPRPTTLS